ncbi:hypothetical protein KN1_09480 [Stygiolobus caldivivus]|uniref:Uncharacterized protein n=1 Tax=Stygiolobus caldivivus TaxID=2824673 RepID=A0A8D5U6C3_9CREN|nr:hypothetical protein KN1_09480 [Stygiolobus caldivivus]
MESKRVCLDSDILIGSFKGDPRGAIGYYTTCVNLCEYLRGMGFIGKNVDGFKVWIEANLTVLCIHNSPLKIASRVYTDLRQKN